MPSGYTQPIADGITFEQFAMNCARAFGACITLRDEPGGGEKIPELFEPSDYHVNARKQCDVRLAELEAMTTEQCAEAAEQDFLRLVESRNQAIERAKQLKAKYVAMLVEVDRWAPPSNDHIELKHFMRKQIEQSISFDCDVSFYEGNEPTRIAAAEWRAEQIDTLRKRIAHHEESYRDEVARTNSRNEWIRLLRESLGQEKPA